MKLSTKGKYGLYAMLYLAQHHGEGPQPLKSMAALGVQEDYLEQLLAALRRAGLVQSIRGAQGGYLLARSPEETSVGDVIRATEGPVRMAECAGDVRACSAAGPCPTRRVWVYLSARINDLMDAISLADVLRQEDLESLCGDPEKSADNIPLLQKEQET